MDDNNISVSDILLAIVIIIMISIPLSIALSTYINSQKQLNRDLSTVSSQSLVEENVQVINDTQEKNKPVENSQISQKVYINYSDDSITSVSQKTQLNAVFGFNHPLIIYINGDKLYLTREFGNITDNLYPVRFTLTSNDKSVLFSKILKAGEYFTELNIDAKKIEGNSLDLYINILDFDNELLNPTGSDIIITIDIVRLNDKEFYNFQRNYNLEPVVNLLQYPKVVDSVNGTNESLDNSGSAINNDLAEQSEINESVPVNNNDSNIKQDQAYSFSAPYIIYTYKNKVYIDSDKFSSSTQNKYSARFIFVRHNIKESVSKSEINNNNNYLYTSEGKVENGKIQNNYYKSEILFQKILKPGESITDLSIDVKKLEGNSLELYVDILDSNNNKINQNKISCHIKVWSLMDEQFQNFQKHTIRPLVYRLSILANGNKTVIENNSFGEVHVYIDNPRLLDGKFMFDNNNKIKYEIGFEHKNQWSNTYADIVNKSSTFYNYDTRILFIDKYALGCLHSKSSDTLYATKDGKKIYDFQSDIYFDIPYDFVPEP